MTKRRLGAAAGAAALAALMTLAAACHRKGDPAAPLYPAVTVSHPRSEPVTEYLEMTGTVAASKTVNLVARVPGYLESVNFKDGAVVPAGALLFVIEQGPYQAQVDLQKAALTRAQAELDRQQAMMKENATAATTVENWVSQRDQAKAQLEVAAINLGYTKVTAPFEGRMGARQADPGNLVGSAGPTVLGTIEQLHPIYVNFNLNERDALHLRDLLRERGIEIGQNIGKAPVEVGLQNEQGYPHVGVLDFADNTLSTSTGTIALRGIFQNADTTLFPGLFARVRIPLGGPRPSLVIPGSATGNDQQGDFVYVVRADDIVERRGIVRGPLTPNGLVVRSGLAPTDRIIVNGLLNARVGEKVAPQDAPPPTPAPAATPAPTTRKTNAAR
jgi:membrane fusion protein, multidrug efflux system